MSWTEHEVPMLCAVRDAEAADTTGHGCNSAYIVEATGLRPALVGRTLTRLIDAGYLGGYDAGSAANAYDEWMGLHLRELGLREVGDWPSADRDIVATIVAVLAATADVVEEIDEEQASKLRKAGSWLGSIGTDLAAKVAAELAARGIGF